MPSRGALLCLASAAAFGAMGIFGKLAYEEGVTVGTLLSVRFVLAAALFWLLLISTGGVRGLRTLPRRDIAIAIALGAVGYSAQAARLLRGARAPRRLAAVAAALHVPRDRRRRGDRPRARTRQPANRGRPGARVGRARPRAGGRCRRDAGSGRSGARAGGSGGLQRLHPDVGGRVRRGWRPLALGTLVCSGAAVTLTFGAAVQGDLDPGAVSTLGFVWLAGVAIVSTVGAIGLFFAGLRRVGPTAASILSTLEPVVTVALAFVVFGESLGPVQLAGGALVLLAVLVVRTPPRGLAAAPASPARASVVARTA